ncbi:MAG: hypothetical protein JJU20_10590 [Opitutales bacterium]|nr:hypothetical protein [Opitutales bacterium]
MHFEKDSPNEALDPQLDRLLSRKPVVASNDFLARLHDRLAAEDAKGAAAWKQPVDSVDVRIDQLLASKPATARPDFLARLRQRLGREESQETTATPRLIRFPTPRWAVAAVAVFALGLATWTQIERNSGQETPSLASHSAADAVLSVDNAHTYDPEITQILALAQNLDPNQELRSLDADRLQSFLLSSY